MTIDVTVEEGVKTLRMNRPEKKNALTNEMYHTLADEMIAADNDPAAIQAEDLIRRLFGIDPVALPGEAVLGRAGDARDVVVERKRRVCCEAVLVVAVAIEPLHHALSHSCELLAGGLPESRYASAVSAGQRSPSAVAIAKWVFMPPRSNPKQTIEQIVEWSNTARKQGLLSLEAAVDAQTDTFIQKGLQMLVDGSEPETLRATLEVDIDAKEHHDLAAAKVFESAGIYAPTLDIIGAVLGLMAVMQNLADPSKLGAGIAAAFVATIYGIGIANLFLLPMANKLKAIIQARSRDQEMLVEGLVSIARGDNPRNIEARLSGYLH